MYKKILVPTDGSKYAAKAEKEALSLAEAYGAEMIALSVVENSFFRSLPADEYTHHINKMLKKETKKNLEKINEIKEKSQTDIDIKLIVEEGSPADVILDIIELEDIDLVVIGSSGKSGFDRFIMGSVADKVVKSAKCSVLVVH